MDEYFCDSCWMMIDDEPFPHPFVEDGYLCEECLLELERENLERENE